MKEPRFPGFTAEASLYKRSESNQLVAGQAERAGRQKGGVTPALRANLCNCGGVLRCLAYPCSWVGCTHVGFCNL